MDLAGRCRVYDVVCRVADAGVLQFTGIVGENHVRRVERGLVRRVAERHGDGHGLARVHGLIGGQRESVGARFLLHAAHAANAVFKVVLAVRAARALSERQNKLVAVKAGGFVIHDVTGKRRRRLFTVDRGDPDGFRAVGRVAVGERHAAGVGNAGDGGLRGNIGVAAGFQDALDNVKTGLLFNVSAHVFHAVAAGAAGQVRKRTVDTLAVDATVERQLFASRGHAHLRRFTGSVDNAVVELVVHGVIEHQAEAALLVFRQVGLCPERQPAEIAPGNGDALGEYVHAADVIERAVFVRIFACCNIDAWIDLLGFGQLKHRIVKVQLIVHRYDVFDVLVERDRYDDFLPGGQSVFVRRRGHFCGQCIYRETQQQHYGKQNG